MFELFEPKREYSVNAGKLPHWYQPGVTYFVTFRTEDSVPQSLVRRWHADRDQWLRNREIDPDRRDWRVQLRASPALEKAFDRRFSQQFMEYLDQGHGDCPLKDPHAAQIVADALLHFDGERYQLSDFVVMPNHVHLLVGLMGNTEIESQCESWKRYSAGEINELLGRKGRFWQAESFDHMVRSLEQFEKFQRYIAENPVKAGLIAGEFLYWSRSAKG